MSSLINGCKRYFKELFDINLQISSWKQQEDVPLFLKKSYVFYRCTVFNQQLLLMIENDDIPEQTTPAAIKKQIQYLFEKWQLTPVYVSKFINSFNRKRLIQHKVPFIIPQNQLYLPMTAIAFQEHFKSIFPKIKFFTPSVQAVILTILLHPTENREYSPSHLATILHYSLMTMSRAFDALESINIGRHFIIGKTRRMRCEESQENIWKKALPYLKSPVKRKYYIAPQDKPKEAVLAGISALSHHTMIEESHKTYAISHELWKAMHLEEKIELGDADETTVELETWSYDPTMFAVNGVVDKQSLFLSLRNTEDERVQRELEKMMEDFE